MSNSLWPHGVLHTKFPVLDYLSEFAQTHVHWIRDAIQQPHSLSPPSLPTLNTGLAKSSVNFLANPIPHSSKLKSLSPQCKIFLPTPAHNNLALLHLYLSKPKTVFKSTMHVFLFHMKSLSLKVKPISNLRGQEKKNNIGGQKLLLNSQYVFKWILLETKFINTVEIWHPWLSIFLRNYISSLMEVPGGGNGNPLQYSCWDNPMERGAWQAIVHGSTNSQTWLSNWVHTMEVSNQSIK